MVSCQITVKNVYLNIPVFSPGQMRLLSKPSLFAPIGGKLSSSHGKIYVEALKDISLELDEGQNVGLIGHNGAGKTTLLRVLAGIYPPSRGEVFVAGHVGCVLEGTSISADMTGRESIKYHCLIHGQGIDWREVEQDVCEFTDLGDFIDLPVRTYSSGMQSRFKAALATAGHQEVLLIDEGIGAGDAQFQRKFAARLDSYLNRAGILVLASHNMAMLSDYCDIALVIEHGELKFFGPLEDAVSFYMDSQKQAN